MNFQKKSYILPIGTLMRFILVGRNITDNVLLAQELVRAYGRATLSPRCAIKIDVQKAFDSVD